MFEELSDLLKKALALPAEARALAGSLLESLDEQPVEDGLEASWSEEIKRRIEEIRRGNVEMIPQEEVQSRLAARLADVKKK